MALSSRNQAFAQEIKIGKQVWSNANLNISAFRNGTPINEAKTDAEWKQAATRKQPAWCYYDNDSANGSLYGKLYNWYAVTDPKGLCPAGWHVPADAEWKKLSDYLGGENNAGARLKTESGWKENGNGTKDVGFSGKPGGSRVFNSSFYYKGSFGYWWSATELTPNDAIARSLFYNSNHVGHPQSAKISGFSVRCLKD